MTMKPKHNKLPEAYLDKAPNKQMQEQMRKLMMKGRQPAEDNRHAGKTINKARQQQRREYVVGQMVKSANQKKAFGMSLSPEETWVLSNRNLFL